MQRMRLVRNGLDNNVFCTEIAAKMAPFSLLPGDFRRVSIEILYDRALGRTAKAGLRLRLSPLSSPCYALVQGDSLPVISLNRRVSKFSQVIEIKYFHA